MKVEQDPSVGVLFESIASEDGGAAAERALPIDSIGPARLHLVDTGGGPS
ncbi:MAG TPA: hypothetical protein VHC69_20180 [Polyangiaceae bacterium]|nr:hypothetical protein [Polyangiaceae bacterium]